MHSILEVRDLNKSYFESDIKIQVLENLNLSVEKGQKVAIIGKSGSGKSTLLNSIIGSVSFNSGLIKIDGSSINFEKERDMALIRRDSLGIIYQQHHLLPDFTALENIQIAQGISEKVDNNQAKRCLIDVGLRHRTNHLPSEMSGGERQRVSIARAIIKNPPLIIADEPTGSLDENTANRIMELLMGLPSSLIMVTHDIDLAKKMDLMYELKAGKLTRI